eukprot:1990649-Rhodomonas_salina.1
MSVWCGTEKAYTPKSNTRNRFSVQFVPGMRFLVFEFAACGPEIAYEMAWCGTEMAYGVVLRWRMVRY